MKSIVHPLSLNRTRPSKSTTGRSAPSLHSESTNSLLHKPWLKGIWKHADDHQRWSALAFSDVQKFLHPINNYAPIIVVVYMCTVFSGLNIHMHNPSRLEWHNICEHAHTSFTYCVHTILSDAWNAWNSPKCFRNKPGHFWQGTRPGDLISIIWIYFRSSVRADLVEIEASHCFAEQL